MIIQHDSSLKAEHGSMDSMMKFHVPMQEERRAVLLQQLTKWFVAEAKEALEYIVPGLNGVDVPGRLVDGGIMVRLLRVQYMDAYGMHKRPTFPEGHYWSNHISRVVS